MTVKREVERLEHSAVRLKLTIGKDDVREEYDEIIKDYAKKIQIPGFRKGKAPRDVLVRKFADAFQAETLAHVVEHSVSDVFSDTSFPEEDRPLPYSQPQVDGEMPELNLEADLSFAVVYDVFPRFAVGTWQGLELAVKDAAVTEEDIARELEAVRERNAVVLDRDDGAAAKAGDVATVNYAEITAEGGAVPGTEREDFVFTIGTGANLFHFDDEVTGMKKGETKDFEKTYGEDFADKDLAGQTKKIRVTLTALKERQLPALDDDLAQDVDEKYQTLEDLKKDIREKLAKNLESRRRDLRVHAILDKVLETTPIDLPESMMRIELESRWRALARQFNADPAQLAELMNRGERSQSAVFDEWRPDVARAIKSRLIVESLVKERGFNAPDEEIEKEYETIAADSNMKLDDVKAYYGQGSMKDYLAEDLKERKLFDLLLAENTIKPGEMVKYLDLLSNNG
ncbi:MAG: trigger factor [Spirochaetaceae bacterium]|nr:trigger factor [Spirochaetaceae bacterium]